MSLTEKLHRCGIKIGPGKKGTVSPTAAALFQSGKWKMQLPVNSMQAITLDLTSKSQQSVRKQNGTELKVHFNTKALLRHPSNIYSVSAVDMCQHYISLYLFFFFLNHN